MMLALSKAQGLILAVGGAIVLLVAGGALLSRGRARRTEEPPRIPFAMRPGPSDPDLETPLLTKLQGWGVLLVAFFGATFSIAGRRPPLPANVTLANLQGTGIVLPTFPANSTITCWATGIGSN